MTWAIVPVKALGEAKQRLAPLLPPPVRRRLVLTMLDHLLIVLAKTSAIGPTLVVTPDPEVADMARMHRALVVEEGRARGMNAALRLGLAVAATKGAPRALVLPADLPLVEPEELQGLLETTSASALFGVTLVPAHDGGGTNAMLLSPPWALAPRFGGGSFARHLAAATARGLDVQVVRLSSLAVDIDKPCDVARLVEHDGKRRLYSFLEPYLPGDVAPTRPQVLC